MTTKTTQTEEVQKLIQMMRKMDLCMLTTVAEDGNLHSRPMSTNGKVDDDGNLWFFTYGNSHKVLEAKQHPQVSVTFSDPKGMTFIALSGTAKLVRDKNKIEELWKAELKAWFPEGTETPDIALLKIVSRQAEYWDSPSSIVAHTIALFKSITGSAPEVGDNKVVDIRSVRAT